MLALSIALAGCTSTSDATLATAKRVIPGFSTTAIPQPTNPQLRYMRVHVGGRVALLVLGEIDEHPLGRIESWYSSEAEVLKFQNGRLVGTAGLTTNWVGVKLIPTGNGYERIRDVMPGYRFGLKDNMVVRDLAHPPAAIQAKAGLTQTRIATLKWQEESAGANLPISHIYIGYETRPDGTKQAAVGYQCIDDAICIQWERL